MKKKDDEGVVVRKPYEVTGPAAAVDRINGQRCQACEGHLVYVPSTAEAESLQKFKGKKWTAAGKCKECSHAHYLVFTLVACKKS